MIDYELVYVGRCLKQHLLYMPLWIRNRLIINVSDEEAVLFTTVINWDLSMKYLRLNENTIRCKNIHLR